MILKEASLSLLQFNHYLKALRHEKGVDDTVDEQIPQKCIDAEKQRTSNKLSNHNLPPKKRSRSVTTENANIIQSKIGRPRKPLLEASARTKRRRVHEFNELLTDITDNNPQEQADMLVSWLLMRTVLLKQH